MLYVFVNKERTIVYFATYDKVDATLYIKEHDVKLATRLFEDVEIYEVIE